MKEKVETKKYTDFTVEHIKKYLDEFRKLVLKGNYSITQFQLIRIEERILISLRHIKLILKRKEKYFSVFNMRTFAMQLIMKKKNIQMSVFTYSARNMSLIIGELRNTSKSI
ncbi:hypothetical protein Desor_4357 [Desulfosporosinus orientis DSM 765]|uniref:Uncharacterized protein n=1 Tax=Desulfosporosinus orientis (strain ATCC 19365 / DSM 765 / NCIMB 8382 / VKM B-1628 / Singapore I) TaxID=768706 RepID=G7WJC3_DESOD|nr:hypothetical protein Desor_4357 [Desulfosporosinus orientis DSM 765]